MTDCLNDFIAPKFGQNQLYGSDQISFEKYSFRL